LRGVCIEIAAVFTLISQLIVNPTFNNTRKKPILDRTQCHCGVWIEQAIQEQFVDKNWLTTLEKAHSAMHDIADNLLTQYQEGNVTEARSGLKDFHEAIEQIYCVLREE